MLPNNGYLGYSCKCLNGTNGPFCNYSKSLFKIRVRVLQKNSDRKYYLKLKLTRVIQNIVMVDFVSWIIPVRIFVRVVRVIRGVHACFKQLHVDITQQYAKTAVLV